MADVNTQEAAASETAERNATYEYYVTANRENGESPLSDPCTVTAIPEFPTLFVGAHEIVKRCGVFTSRVERFAYFVDVFPNEIKIKHCFVTFVSLCASVKQKDITSFW